MTATAIIGGQWGSEGKGVVAAALAGHFDAAVRVGGPNAGHSFYHGDTKYVARGVPCAWVNPEADLLIGAGAVVDPAVLLAELGQLPGHVTVMVDGAAALVRTDDHQQERDAGMWEAIGSTMEGVGAARIRKIRRMSDGQPVYARDYPWPVGGVRLVEDSAQWLADLLRSGGAVMLEGTQGSGLSIHFGTQQPFTTSADTNASGLAADCGVAPSHVEHTLLVARTLPIRVAGNSGPMGDELSWDQLQEHAGVAAPEKTTVTQRVRRISRWYDPVFARAVALNDPCGVFLMFADYLAPEMAGTTDAADLLDAAQPGPLGDLRSLTAQIEIGHGVPIVAYGTGGPRWSLAFRGRCAHGFQWDPRA